MPRTAPAAPALDGYLSQADAADYLGVSVRTIRQLISDGRLPAYRLSAARNGLVRLRRADLDALLTPIPTVGAATAAAG